jgi:hypothetical protein
MNESAGKLNIERTKMFHTFVLEGMFLFKSDRHVIHPGISFLTTRVKDPNKSDWRKLIKILNSLKATQTQVATMSMDNSGEIKWYVDAAFAMHQDNKSHTGACMTLGSGTFCSIATKQKVNSRSSTEAEFIVVDDVIGKILWTKLFLE